MSRLSVWWMIYRPRFSRDRHWMSGLMGDVGRWSLGVNFGQWRICIQTPWRYTKKV